MSRVADFPTPAHAERDANDLHLPEFVIEDAGSGDGFDVTRICNTHRWASLPVVREPGMPLPECALCQAAREQIDGFARYRDLVAKRKARV